jgi:hypothetical protein
MTAPAAPHQVERIADEELAGLIERRLGGAASSGLSYIRNTSAFRGHLLDVARRAELVATRLRERVPPGEAPDPVALFVAGAWHDGGKISAGEDYHEITSAIEVIEHGASWELARGSAEDVHGVLVRAASAILPGFALYEQCQPAYVPTWWSRARLDDSLHRLRARLSPRLLPRTMDDLVLMYADMVDPGDASPFDIRFERRWADVEARSLRDDRALYEVLGEVRPRVYEGCALVERFLTDGYDPGALARFRERWSVRPLL